MEKDAHELSDCLTLLMACTHSNQFAEGENDFLIMPIRIYIFVLKVGVKLKVQSVSNHLSILPDLGLPATARPFRLVAVVVMVTPAFM